MNNEFEIILKLTIDQKQRHEIIDLLNSQLSGNYTCKQYSYGYSLKFQNSNDKIIAKSIIDDINRKYKGFERTGTTKAGNIAKFPKSL